MLRSLVEEFYLSHQKANSGVMIDARKNDESICRIHQSKAISIIHSFIHSFIVFLRAEQKQKRSEPFSFFFLSACLSPLTPPRKEADGGRVEQIDNR